MRFEQLECLLAVEETGSFVGAATSGQYEHETAGARTGAAAF